MDFNYDLNDLQAQSDEVKRKKALLRAAGLGLDQVANAGLDASSNYQTILTGQKLNGPAKSGIAESFNSMADSIDDPWEKKKQQFDMFKTSSEAKNFQDSQDLISREKDPASKESMALRQLAPRWGIKVSPDMSAHDIKQLISPKDMMQTEAKAVVDFNNDTKKMQFQNKLAKDLDTYKTNEELRKAMEARKANPEKYAWESLKEETRDQITNLAKKNADTFSVRNFLASGLEKLRDDSLSTDEKIKSGQEMLKFLNSPMGSDAVGAEEAKRLGSFLEQKFFNVSQPGSMFGRDLDLFTKQVENNINKLGSTVEANQKTIDQLRTGKKITDMIQPVGETERSRKQLAGDLDMIENAGAKPKMNVDQQLQKLNQHMLNGSITKELYLKKRRQILGGE